MGVVVDDRSTLQLLPSRKRMRVELLDFRLWRRFLRQPARPGGSPFGEAA